MGLLGKLFRERERVVPEHVETFDDFQRVTLQPPGPLVLYVWGPSCGPCQRMTHEVTGAATKHRGRVRFAEVSTTADPVLLEMLEVRATPTVIVYDQGEEVGRETGFRPASWFDAMIDAELSGA